MLRALQQEEAVQSCRRIWKAVLAAFLSPSLHCFCMNQATLVNTFMTHRQQCTMKVEAVLPMKRLRCCENRYLQCRHRPSISWAA